MVTRIVRRYTKALYEQTAQLGLQKAVTEDINSLLILLKANQLLKNFFRSPVINKVKKQSAIKMLFEGKVNKVTLDFILFLVEQTREDLILEMFEDFIKYDKEMTNKIDVNVSSVIELDDKTKNTIIEEVKAYSGKEVIPSFDIDESLIGGFKINMGDYVIDASISRQLEIIKNKFKQVSL
ncbi:MAG TPA: ATP synthase F1 subunit delta [Ignavibacteria bacterium]|nr:ATP synthase F1 subunit delta [Ignavibacteria bacterium]